MKTKTIEGYTVQVEFDGDRGQCHVAHGKYSASLACLADTGALTNHRDQEHVVPAWIVGQIETYAEANGYND